MHTDRELLLLLVAPTLRGLLADGPVLPTLDLAVDPPVGPSGLTVAVPGGADGTVVLAVLRQALDGHRAVTGAPPMAVTVPGLGTFRPVPARGSGRVAGRVAVITGAAQGFGREIAAAFAAAGGTVVLADRHADGARAAAQELIVAHGPGRALGLAVDVTDGASVAGLVHQVVRAYGGFDVLVANAGVVRSDSVLTQREEDFDLVAAVNYKGYFLCVQHGAPVLARQAAARPGYASDIIQINSKSGLTGSNRNAAYAGSKFGGIGLTQSFALELVADRIKVNAICPGNFLDGPLWTDPDTGLFVQYLRSGKVPGAATVDDVRRAYESKVPMGRGCRTADVMQAVFYLIDQQYETGQALPVTGGQVMLP